jgi:hypothetical protein
MTIYWKPYTRLRRDGSSYGGDAGVMNLDGTRHYLEILNMPPKRPLTFEQAKRLEHVEFQRLLEMKRYRELGQLALHWVDWISAQGFHVVLNGEEFTFVPEVPRAAQTEPLTLSISLQVGGRSLRLLTFKNRPPIYQVRIRREDLIEIHYTTGESEEARVQSSDYPDSFCLKTLWSEHWQGQAPAVRPYRWVA